MPSSRRPSPRGSGPRGRTGPGRPGSGGRPPGRRPPASADQRGRPRFTGRAAILVLVLLVLMVSYASSARAYLEQKEHLADLRASIAQSQRNIEHLQREKRRWEDPAFVEAQARARFGWVMPGEIAYQVIGSDGEPLSADESLSEPDGAVPADHPVWWEAAWGSVVAAGSPEDLPAPPAEEIRAPQKPNQKKKR